MRSAVSKTWLLRAGAVALAGLSLAACGKNNDSSAAVTTTTTTTAPPLAQSTFGANFATDFAATANSAPAKVAAGDIIALTLTAAPSAVR